MGCNAANGINRLQDFPSMVTPTLENLRISIHLYISMNFPISAAVVCPLFLVIMGGDCFFAHRKKIPTLRKKKNKRSEIEIQRFDACWRGQREGKKCRVGNRRTMAVGVYDEGKRKEDPGYCLKQITKRYCSGRHTLSTKRSN